MKRVLVAGVGNIFLGDDAFGVEVAQRLCAEAVPSGVRVVDFGIRSLHLAYELLDGEYDLTVLVDASPRGGAPGTLYVIEPDLGTDRPAVAADAHAMNPDAVFTALRALGGEPGRVMIVGCEPASVEEGMGLSAEVSAAVDEGVKLVLEVLARECTEGECDVPGDSRPDRAVAS
ncbi:MAG: hybD [Candidatus Solibacter sp.]|jgi:hydrogenase maturation protease|nr:hybD [Candidatus Solibacter sp.]